MGILISLIVFPVQAILERRKKKKAEEIARNYTTTDTALQQQSQSQSQSQLQSRHPDTQQESSAPPPPELSSEQQQQQPVEELNTTLGAARVSYPTPVSNASTPFRPPPPHACSPPGTDTKAVPTADKPTTTTAGTASERAAEAAAGEGDAMASDEDYMAFLDKANQDPNVGYSALGQKKTGGKVQLKTVDAGVVVPDELRMASEREEWIYVSDADEPFVAVGLALEGDKLPDEETFAKMINHPDPASADIEILDPVKWDSTGQYKDVVDATRKASSGGDVRVYRVALGGTRVEYWVVGVSGAGKGKGAKLVGVKALAVES